MPDYATSSGDPSRGRSPRPVVVAGEVTPKKQNSESASGARDCIAPPAFGGKRIFGAKNFLGAEFAVADAQAGHGDAGQDADIRTLARLRLETSSSQASTLVPDDTDYHPLEAPAGWRRFWSVMDKHHSIYDYIGDPDITLSPFCKRCYDSGDAEFCDMTKRGTVTWGREHNGPRCDHCKPGDECRFLITYRHGDNVPIDKLPTYKLRNLARQWVAAGDQGLRLPIASAEFSPYLKPVLPRPAPTTIQKSTAQAKLASPLALPTYSQTRTAYYHLKESATRAPPPERDVRHEEMDSLGRTDNRPLWVADMHIHPGSSFRPAQQALFPSALIDRHDNAFILDTEVINRGTMLNGNDSAIGLPEERREAATEASEEGPDTERLRQALLREMEKLCRLSRVEAGMGTQREC